MRLTRFSTLWMLSAAALLLAACTPAPTPGGGGENKVLYTKLGVVGLSRFDTGFVSAQAQFLRLPIGLAQAPGPVAEQCVVFESPSATPPSLPDPAAGQAATSLDAGDPITLQAGGVYATLSRSVQNGAYGYSALLQDAPPANLSLTIPGASGGFPAVGSAALPPIPAALDLTAPSGAADIGPETVFSWSNPSNDAQTQVSFAGFQRSPDLGFSCTTPDDGRFTFPAATQTELKAKGWASGQFLFITRQTTRSVVQHDALLLLFTQNLTLTGSIADPPPQEPPAPK